MTTTTRNDMRKIVEIDFMFVDLQTCTRCKGTDANLATAQMPAPGATQALAATALSDTPAGYRSADATFEKASPERTAAVGTPEQSPRYAVG